MRLTDSNTQHIYTARLTDSNTQHIYTARAANSTHQSTTQLEATKSCLIFFCPIIDMPGSRVIYYISKDNPVFLMDASIPWTGVVSTRLGVRALSDTDERWSQALKGYGIEIVVTRFCN